MFIKNGKIKLKAVCLITCSFLFEDRQASLAITCPPSCITRKGKTHGRWSYCRVSSPPPNPDGQDNKDDSIRNLLLSLNRCKFVGITKITKRDCFLDLRATKYQRM